MGKRLGRKGWILSLCALIGLLSIGGFFGFNLEKFSISVSRFTDRAIGNAIVMGIDPRLRTLVYAKACLYFIFFFVLCYALISWFDSQLTKKSHRLVLPQKKRIFLLSLFSIAEIVLYLLTQKRFYINIVRVLLFVTAVNLLIIFLKDVFVRSKKPKLLVLFSSQAIIDLALLAPFFYGSAWWVIFGGKLEVDNRFFLWYPIFLAIFFVLYQIAITIAKKYNLGKKLLDHAILFFHLPLSFYPLLIPIANEIQFGLSSLTKITAREISISLLVFSFLASLLLFRKKIREAKNPKNLQRVFWLFYFPIIIAALAMFRYYNHGLALGPFDLLHKGERTTPVQQLFQYGKIPYVDFLPAHGLSDLLFQSFYSLINGYRGLEMLIWWELLPKVFAAIILYFVLYSISKSPIFSFLTIILLPTESFYFYNVDVAFSFLSVLCFYLFLKKPASQRLYWIWLSNIFVSLWTPSLGVATFLGSILMLLLFFVKNKWRYLREAFLSFVYVAGGSFVFYILLLAIKQKNIADVITLIFQYLKADTLIGGYAIIAKGYSPLAIFQYVLCPALFAVCFLTVIVKLINREKVGAQNFILAFVAIMSLVLSFRGLARHGLIEGFNPYFFLFLLLVFPFSLESISRRAAQIFFVTVLLLYHFLFPNFSVLAKEGELFWFKNWRDKEARVVINDDSQYRSLSRFLDFRLSKEQTFYEFINAPMLYFFTNREVPGQFFLPTLFYSSDPSQLITLKNLQEFYDNEKMPIVIFRKLDWFGWHIDNIPSEARSFRITEFIYRNYEPLGEIDDYLIFEEKRAFTQKTVSQKINEYKEKGIGLVGVSSVDKDFPLSELPYIWANYDPKMASSKTIILQEISPAVSSLAVGQTMALDLKQEIDKSLGNYLQLRIKSEQKGILRVKIDLLGPEINFDLKPTGKSEDYLVRISSWYKWTVGQIAKIYLSASVPIDIEKVLIRKGD